MALQTQSDDLKQKLRTYEVQLQHAQLFGDVTSQKKIFNKICVIKDTLLNIQ